MEIRTDKVGFSEGLKGNFRRKVGLVLRRLRAHVVAWGHGTSMEQLPALMASCRQRIIVFDVFDTLVTRLVRPEHVKLLAADRLVRSLGMNMLDGPALYEIRRRVEAELGRQNLHLHGEAELRFVDLAARLQAVLKQQEPVVARMSRGQFHEWMLKTELAVEREVLRPVPGATAAIREARVMGKKIVLLSDFYLPAPSLKDLLRSCGLPVDDCPLLVSCDMMASKRSGRAYEVLLKQHGARPDDILMIGDDAHSDVMRARDKGIATILVDARSQHRFYGSTAASVANRAALREAVQDVLQASPLGEKRNFRALAVALLVFIERLHAELRTQGIEHVAFLAREGQALRLMFEAYQDMIAPQEGRIRAHYVKISRRAAYIASLRPLDDEDFSDFMKSYGGMATVEDFLRSLGLGVDAIARMAAEAGLEPESASDAVLNADIIDRLRDSPLFRRLYERERIRRKRLLRRYLLQQGIPLDTSPLVIVDVGWKGSIQDFLSRAVEPPCGTLGYYIGLVACGQGLAGKKGLLFDNVRNSRFWRIYDENRSLFEILLCADHHGALAYEEDGKGHVVVREDREDPKEQAWIEASILPIRNDLLKAFRELLCIRDRHVCDRQTWERMAAEHFAGLVFRPWLVQMRWLAGQARHRENFGVFGSNRLVGEGESPDLRRRFVFLLNMARRPRHFLGRQPWPAGSIYWYLGRIPALAYAMLRRCQGAGP